MDHWLIVGSELNLNYNMLSQNIYIDIDLVLLEKEAR